MNPSLRNSFKIILLSLFHLSAYTATFGQADDVRLDSTYSFQFNSATDSIPLKKDICSYTTIGNTLECYNFTTCISSSWDAQTRTWTPFYKSEFRTEEEGKKTSSIIYNMDESSQTWRPIQRTFILSIDRTEEESRYDWDTLATSWIFMNFRKYTKDERGNLLYNETKTYSREERIWQGGREIQAFDDEDRRVEYSYANWDNEREDWRPENRYTQTHTSAGRVSERIQYFWDKQANDWDQGSVETYTYNSENQLTRLEISSGSSRRIDIYIYNDQGLEIYFERSYQQGFFLPPQAEDKRSQTYDEQGNLLISERSTWNYDSMRWEVQNRDEHSYNSLGQLILIKMYEKDFLTGSYYFKHETSFAYTPLGIESFKQKLTYNEQGEIASGSQSELIYDAAGRLNVRITSYWNKDQLSWILSRKSETLYDKNGQFKCFAWYQWNAQVGQWEGGAKTGFNYDEQDNLSRSYRAFWRPQQNDWFITSSTRFYYGACLKEHILADREISLQIYPNPVSESWAFIETELALPAKYEILDTQGKRILAGELTALVVPIHLKDLGNGMYILRCTSGNQSEVRKFIVAKP